MLGSWIIYSTYQTHPKFASDFGNWYWAAKAVLAGDDPYLTVGPTGMKYMWPTPFVYPLTVVFLAIPSVGFPEPVAAAGFVGISKFVKMFAVTREDMHY